MYGPDRPSSGGEWKSNGLGSVLAETGERVSVADWGGVKAKLPKDGVMLEGDMCAPSGRRRRVSMLRGRIKLLSWKPAPKPVGEVSALLMGGVEPKGECSAWVMSKSSGSARDLIMRSWSSVVNRLSFARLFRVSDMVFHAEE
jgi:hypothetical protein